MQAHYEEIQASERGPLAVAIYEATKNVMVFKDSPGAAIPDWEATNEARAKIEARVCREFVAAKAEEHHDGEAGT
jgi:hypothetical protein